MKDILEGMKVVLLAVITGLLVTVVVQRYADSASRYTTHFSDKGSVVYMTDHSTGTVQIYRLHAEKNPVATFQIQSP